MASKRRKKEDAEPAASPEGMFKNMVVFLVETGVQARRLQVWKQKLVQMGATIEGHLSRRVTHVFAMTLDTLLHQVDRSRMIRFKGSALAYRWLEDSLKHGERMLEDSYRLEELEKVNEFGEHLDDKPSENLKRNTFVKNLLPYDERAESSKQSEARDATEKDNIKENNEEETTGGGPSQLISNVDSCRKDSEEDNKDSTSLYTAPDLNRNITEIFGKLINIYRALGDDRRSFSYHKAISVIEKLPFKIQSVDQVKALPSIGKAMQDHIHEIVTTGKLLKLEHFESDEKVRTVALFEEVWGIGPATALKLYEKGHRSLSDLEKEDSLTSSQKTGLKYFEDIKRRITREEVKDMETLLQKAGEDVLPGVIIICGGSYRRGKATCGDMDIVITHPDGESHKGFLVRYVQYLKDIKFLREDLVFSIHSMEGTDSGVDTYFGLCTYPGREQRHRIDFKAYPRNIFAFGLIAWTGNDVLNRRLRLLAETKGYRLDDTGLYLATQSSGGKKGTKSSTSVKCNTEKEVFDFLGFPWLEPRERNL